MKTRQITYLLVALLAGAGLGACAPMQQDQAHQGHHPGRSADSRVPSTSQQSAQGGMGAGMTGSMEPADKEAMCARFRGMRDAPDEQARQAMMHKEIGAMSPEMRQRHMEMMRKQCQ